jgi:transcription elongation GreA/GreB family factor
MSDPATLKARLRDRMHQLEEDELATAIAHYERFLAEAVLDDREQHDNSEIAEAREHADLAVAFDHPVHTHQAKLGVIEATDFGVTDVVGPGAVVSFGGRSFVVAVSTSKFDCEGETYMGISIQSPIYKAMAGLGEGDSFTFNGREITLDRVF